MRTYQVLSTSFFRQIR